ncbi:F-box/kelch-repeat protein At3g23880-like [Coffea arabica]|uniref:F-box/kelch-repeat protein At3g23880-like n=1 Tax=Coffea arabica TaxID=13443 RepID=A0A6P6WU36_COFAR|nr:F-box/kelch-repeat protein At3g23880-like [Coffea arabica]
MESPNLPEADQVTGQQIKLPEIPGQIIPDILSRLPVKSLCRFKCVSKSWQYLVSDPKFSLKTNVSRAIFWIETSPFLHSVNPDLLGENILNPLSEISYRPNQNQVILGSCKGFILFSYSTSIYLWNPSIRCCKKVLRLSLLRENYTVVASGICFDEVSDDYKIVILLSLITGRRIILLASLRSQAWAEINHPHSMFSAKSGPVVNGNIHWVVREEKGDRDLIFYFDKTTNRFVKLPMPDNNVGDSTDIFRLGVLDGCLTLSRFGNIWDLEHITEVLIMKEYGVKESWMTLCRIPMKGPRIWSPPLFYIKGSRDEVLISNGLSVVVFSLKDQTMREFPFAMMPHDFCMYVESLTTIPERLRDQRREQNASGSMERAAGT